ncbi:MAG: hypothetical protein ACJ0HN_04090 [Alphaproteobacteria bacterium]
MDATGRTDRIRYDSPSIYGFQFRTAIIQQDAYEFALWYKGKVAGMRVRAAINRSHGAQEIFGGADDAGLDAGDELTIYNGSISVRSPWGASVSAVQLVRVNGIVWRKLTEQAQAEYRLGLKPLISGGLPSGIARSSLNWAKPASGMAIT